MFTRCQIPARVSTSAKDSHLPDGGRLLRAAEGAIHAVETGSIPTLREA